MRNSALDNMDLPNSAFLRRYNRLANGPGKGDLVLRAGEEIISRPDTQSFLMSRFVQEEPAVKLAIAVAISRVSGDQSPIGIYETLLEAVKTPQKFQAEYDKYSYKASDAPVDALMGFCFFKNRSDETVSELSNELDNHSGWIATNISHALLYCKFRLDPGHRLPYDVLTPEQVSILHTLLASRRAWRLNGNMAMSLERFGLPTTKSELETFLSCCRAT